MYTNLHRLLAEYPLEKLLQTIPTGLFLVDTEKTVVYWNTEAERMTGYSAEEAVGRHCAFLEGDPCEQACGLFDTEVEKPQIGISCTIRHKDGHTVTLTKNVDLLRDKQGSIIGGIEAFVDVSRLKKLETDLRSAVAEQTRELELEKAGLRAVLDGMQDPAYLCDTDYHIVFANRAMQEVVGDIHSKLCYQAIFNRDEVCESCPMPTVLQGRIVNEERYLEATGRIYEVIHSPYPMASNATQKLGVCRDITERLEAERRLRQANRELDAFVSTVSHDLRSPLTPLIGFAELLEERYAEQLDDLGRECLSEIKKTARKMKNLLEDLLSLSRVGQLKEPDEPVDATRVAEEILLELADRVLESQAQVQIRPLPRISIPEPLLSDLFRNLLVNSLNYAVHQDPRIEVSGHRFFNRVRYWVVDHGPGIAAQERERVFEPFRRGLHSGAAAGTGIGLATVAKIAQVYGGSAWAEETAGGGATLVVDLPAPKKR